MKSQIEDEFPNEGEKKILTDERIAEFSNKVIEKPSKSDHIKKRRPYTKFDFKTKLEILRGLEKGRDTTEIAKEFNVSPRRIRRVSQYNVLFKENSKKFNDSDGLKENPETNDRDIKEKNILLRKGLEFFEKHGARPSISVLAEVYLDDEKFFRSNSKKVNFTRRLKKYISRKLGLSHDSNSLEKKPFSRIVTLQKLEQQGNFMVETALRIISQPSHSRVPSSHPKNSQICPTIFTQLDYNREDDLEFFTTKQVEEDPLTEFHENSLDCLLLNSGPSMSYLDL